MRKIKDLKYLTRLNGKSPGEKNVLLFQNSWRKKNTRTFVWITVNIWSAILIPLGKALVLSLFETRRQVLLRDVAIAGIVIRARESDCFAFTQPELSVDAFRYWPASLSLNESSNAAGRRRFSASGFICALVASMCVGSQGHSRDTCTMLSSMHY